jgi:hypothetical protein
VKGSSWEIYKILNQALSVVALFELVKGDFLRKNIIFFSIEQW